MPRSLLDTADLVALRSLAGSDPATAIAAALVDTGALQFDADDPQWEDRDRLVVGGNSVVAAVTQRLVSAGAAVEPTVHVASGESLAVALGAAVASRLDGGVWRAWCVIDESVCDDGRNWEAARAAAEAGVRMLTALVAGDDSAALWRACGWKVETVPAGDPAWLLGAIDQALVSGATAVLVSADE